MMEVDGKKFREARLAIKNGSMLVQEHREKGSKALGPKKGTQAWLAELSGVDERTIQNLESGKARQETIDAVSPYLKINGNQYIYGHGERHVKCGANKYVDFRPVTCPDPSGSYIDSNLMVTIDPLFIEFIDIDLDSVTLNEIKASIDLLDCRLTWWSFVNIGPSSNWLGQIEETNQLVIEDHNIKFWSIMFKQEGFPNLSWGDFVRNIESSNVEYLEINISLVFSYFEKKFSIKVKRSDLVNNFSISREKYCSPYPYRIQVRPLVLA